MRQKINIIIKKEREVIKSWYSIPASILFTNSITLSDMVPHIVIISINDNIYQIYSKEQTTMNLVKCDICQLNSTKLAAVYQIK